MNLDSETDAGDLADDVLVDDSADDEPGLPPTSHLLIRPEHLPRPCVDRLMRHVIYQFQAPDLAREVVTGALLSLSLDLASKDRVVRSDLSIFQMTELVKVFEDERTEFAKLGHEAEFIIGLGARTLWDTFALVGHLCETTPALESAWCRRTVRRAARGGLKDWLDRMEDDWWAANVHARWAYRGLYPEGHRPWRA